jgi:hypothetical protein
MLLSNCESCNVADSPELTKLDEWTSDLYLKKVIERTFENGTK